MRITEVNAFFLSCPLPAPLRLTFHGGERTIFKRDAGLVRLATDRGLIGFGPLPASEDVVNHVNGPIRDALVGTDPARTEAIRDRLADSMGLAFGAVEIALYDLRGKIEGCPIHALLGGKVRNRLRLYGSAGMYQSPAGYAAEAAAVAALGFTAYKMRPGIGPDADLDAVRRIREAVGPSFGVMVDAHTWWRMGDRSYQPDEIERLARAMASSRITWLEEPLPPEDRDGYVRLRRAGAVPIAAGEHETSLQGFDDIIRRGAVDIVQADVVHHGGYSAVRQVLTRCAAQHLPFAFHSWGTLLEVIANAHLGVCSPESLCAWLEYPCYRHRGQPILYPYPLADDILCDPLTLDGSDLIVPDGAGLGVDVDESVLQRYPHVPGPWSVYRLTEPPEEWALSGDHAAGWTAR